MRNASGQDESRNGRARLALQIMFNCGNAMAYKALIDVGGRSGSFRESARSFPRKAAMIGNFPPRVCGIATFTRDLLAGLSQASPRTEWVVVAMNDRPETYPFPDLVRHVVAHDAPDQYVLAAEEINRSGAEIAFVQHEFGIFGGPAGDYLLMLLRRLRMPAVVTMHTVLERPDLDQRRVTDEILQNAAAVIVMAEKGAELLENVYGADRDSIHVIPHGAPARPFLPTRPFKERHGVLGRKTITTFGLLSPNKGLETAIEALPHIAEHHPEVLYIIVGATHPNLLAQEGERYREHLVAMVGRLGVSGNVQFINRYVDDDELIDLLLATDIYVTPYLTEAQITSGTLSYALALGRPIVSTPYWHAVEALADDLGVLCGFRDSACFAREIAQLLEDERRRDALARRTWQAGIRSRWRNVGQAYLDVADSIVLERAEAG
jgi:glycosyltransferase involved in cell wall biosynthesis